MYAIVEISGKQFKVEKDKTLNIDIIEQKGDKLTLDKVLLYSNEDKVLVGKPYLKNVKVEAKIVKEIAGPKVRGIKFRRKKNHQVTFGHREKYLQIKIDRLVIS